MKQPAPTLRRFEHMLQAALPRLLREPHAFEFHQAVRLATHWLARQPAPERARLRFRNGHSLAFPSSELQALELEDGQAPAGDGQASLEAEETVKAGEAGARDAAGPPCLSITPAFMGLLGAAGALPAAYSERIAAHEAQHRDQAARAFLDIFQHRAVSLFHASWRRHRLALQAEALPRDDRTLALVLDLTGLAPAAWRTHAQGGQAADEPGGNSGAECAAVPATVLAHYAGLLQRRGASAAALRRVLADYLGVGVRIEQFVGRWCAMPADSRCRLGGEQAVLAGAAVLGERVWQRDLRLRLVLGPLDAAQQRRFLPRQGGARALRELLALAGGASLECEVAFHLPGAAVARARLGGGDDGATRLGWNGFLLSRASPGPREETVYELHHRPAPEPVHS